MRTLRIMAGGWFALCGSVATQAQNPFEGLKSYSATIEMSNLPPPAAGQDMKIYRSGDRIRTNLPGGMGYSIVDAGQHISYMVMGNGMCMQMSSPPEETPLFHSADTTVERAAVGTETVDGHVCKVENVSVTPHSGPRAGQTTTVKVWEAQDLRGFPIKMESQTSRGPVTIQYKDVSLSEPDATLFTHPDSCRSMPAMPSIPGMPGAPGAPGR